MAKIHCQREQDTLTLTIQNPNRANALNTEMLAHLQAAVEMVEQDTSIRLLVLKGQSGGIFSAGADIHAWSSLSPQAYGQDWVGGGNRLFDRFEKLRCPTLAVIEGLCWGGALELALCADLRLATEAASFRLPEVTIGVFAGWKGGLRLAQLIGRGRAMEAVLCAREIDAITAERWGMVNEVCNFDLLEKRATDWCERLLAISSSAAAWAKAATLVNENIDEHYQLSAQACRASPDAKSWVQAFFDRKAKR